MPKNKVIFLLLAALFPLTACGKNIGWIADFTPQPGRKLPDGWKFDGGKFMVPETEFALVPDGDGSTQDGGVLRITSPKATGVIITIPGADLKKYPILRWRWRVHNLPPGADSRTEIDEQSAAVYFGAGGPLSRKSISYRWETEMPPGISGHTKYAGGIVQVHYIGLRNKEHKLNTWYTEERNAAEDFKKVYGYLPENGGYVVSIGANSQYSGSTTVAEVDFIALCSED